MGTLRRKYNLFLSRHFNQYQSNLHAPQLTSGELPLSTPKALQVAEGDSRQLAFRNLREPMNHFSHGISHFSQKTNASLGP